MLEPEAYGRPSRSVEIARSGWVCFAGAETETFVPDGAKGKHYKFVSCHASAAVQDVSRFKKRILL